MFARLAVFTGLTGLLLLVPLARSDEFELFEKTVRPVLVEHCYRCHSDRQQKGGIRLDGPTHLTSDGDGAGPLVVAGDPEQSRLIQVLRYTEEPKMPPAGKLPEEAIAALTTWVKKGARWPAENIQVAKKARAEDHWAFRPVRAPSLPAVSAANWPAGEIDRFILAKLESKNLTPSEPADRRTLMRRVTFDLTGLPPSAGDLEAFRGDPSPEAYTALVDRLLASPQFGERWGRHWLDVARYADSKGPVASGETAYPAAATYRDWVVRLQRRPAL